ncbi:hypothetical protein L861_17615 [Litchfieldella anticariensis FP35 = DSM 16096]|uniref:Uncharacterized protein n=1 Tax=Litchfieldella anticariensis (strain DSM 16096 / CECT 5854 / CIP 108499 / LMG 22089 / FP35) TaxID=1121939 RepID=S2KN50_LITA3|nr:hypothetical protein L861_17615 [Halomonas anticariensis FP35 = DSM 16096]
MVLSAKMVASFEVMPGSGVDASKSEAGFLHD